jgi:hypothetical protein
MRTAKHRNIKNRTIKGGLSNPNTKVHLIVRKSNIDHLKLIYDLVIAKPAFPFITDYMYYNMNAVDEALSLIRMKEMPVKNVLANVDKPEPDVLYKDTFEYGYNKIDDDNVTPEPSIVVPQKSNVPPQKSNVPPQKSLNKSATAKATSEAANATSEAAKASSEAVRKLVAEMPHKSRIAFRRESTAKKTRSTAKKTQPNAKGPIASRLRFK